MESIIKDQMLHYLLQNNLISKQQHGFLARRSTCSQLIECVNDWSLVLNTRNSVDCANIDFSKAFDSVVHSKLCVNLASFGNGFLPSCILERSVQKWVTASHHYPKSSVVYHKAASWVHFFFSCS